MNTRQTLCETLRANDFDEAADEIERLRAALENISNIPYTKSTSMRTCAALKAVARDALEQGGAT